MDRPDERLEHLTRWKLEWLYRATLSGTALRSDAGPRATGVFLQCILECVRKCVRPGSGSTVDNDGRSRERSAKQLHEHQEQSISSRSDWCGVWIGARRSRRGKDPRREWPPITNVGRSLVLRGSADAGVGWQRQQRQTCRTGSVLPVAATPFGRMVGGETPCHPTI